MWGWRIPVRSNEKSVRANYRWVKGFNCTLADISYHTCLQLIGPRVEVNSILSGCLVFPHRIMDGREHERLFHDPNSRLPLGIVMLLSHRIPSTEKTDQNIVGMCVWAHPSISQNVGEVLHKAAEASSVKVFNLEKELSRFRLVGCGAQALLSRALHVVDTKLDPTITSSKTQEGYQHSYYNQNNVKPDYL